MTGVLNLAGIMLQTFWLVVLVALAPVLLAGFFWKSGGAPPSSQLSRCAGTPLVAGLWASIVWAAATRDQTVGWRSLVLLSLGAVGLILPCVIVVQARGAPRWWLLLPCALGSIALLLATGFIGGMAITNDWL